MSNAIFYLFCFSFVCWFAALWTPGYGYQLAGTGFLSLVIMIILVAGEAAKKRDEKPTRKSK